MINDKNLHFIKNKMEDAGQAIVYRYIDETHKQALGLKTAIKIDDDGKLYFVMQNEFEKKYCDDLELFPVEIFFYKKGKPFYVTAKGMAKKAELVSNAKSNKSDDATVSIKINEVEYYELQKDADISPWKRMINGLSNIQAAF